MVLNEGLNTRNAIWHFNDSYPGLFKMHSIWFCDEVLDGIRKKERRLPLHVHSIFKYIRPPKITGKSVRGVLCSAAVELGHIDLVYYLNKKRIKGGKKWSDSKYEVSPLHVACRLGDEKLIHYLLDGNLGASLEEKGYGYVVEEPSSPINLSWNAMNYLLTNDRTELLEAFHEYYDQSKDESERSILHLCCESRAYKCATWCLENNIQDLEAKDSYGCTPLLFSLKLMDGNGSDFAEIFASAGADLLARCHYDSDSLSYAVGYESNYIIAGAMVKSVKTILKYTSSEYFTKREYERALEMCAKYRDSNDHVHAEIRGVFRQLLARHGGQDLILMDPLFEFHNLLSENDFRTASFMIDLIEECAQVASGSWRESVYRSLVSFYEREIFDMECYGRIDIDWAWELLEEFQPRVIPLVKRLLHMLVRNGVNELAFLYDSYGEYHLYDEEIPSILYHLRDLVASITPRSAAPKLQFPLRSLQDECRHAVYWSMGGRPVGKVEKLMIPDVLKSYLLFENE